MNRLLLLAPLAFVLAACQPNRTRSLRRPTPRTTAAADTTAHLAHQAYVRAINSNNLDSLLSILTDDVVYLAPNEPPYVGKAAVRPWLEGYFAAYKTHWDKPVQEFVVAGEWAFERYSYTSTDTPQRRRRPCCRHRLGPGDLPPRRRRRVARRAGRLGGGQARGTPIGGPRCHSAAPARVR